MVIKDQNERDKIKQFLSNTSYYRFSGYTFSFQDRKDKSHPFATDVSFDNIKDLYYFDQELRHVLMNAISKIEIAFRCQIINQYSLNHGSHWHTDPSLFKNRSTYNSYYNDLIKSCNEIKSNKDRKHEFIKHYYDHYNKPSVPPNWMSIEILTLGQLSHLYKNLDDSKGPKSQIAKYFGLKTTGLMANWIHALNIIRNICAHHDRLWNRSISVEIINSKIISEDMLHPFIITAPSFNFRLYSSICCIQYLLDRIDPNNDFRREIKLLMTKIPPSRKGEMGFIKNWDKENYWK